MQNDNTEHEEERKLERGGMNRDQMGCSHCSYKCTFSELWVPSSSGQMSRENRSEGLAKLDSQYPQRNNHHHFLNHAALCYQ